LPRSRFVVCRRPRNAGNRQGRTNGGMCVRFYRHVRGGFRRLVRMVRAGRWVMPWSSRWIDRAEAQARAEDAVAARGLLWMEPVSVMRQWGERRVMPWSTHRGGNVFVDVDVDVDGGTEAVKRVAGPTQR
jgi:hypothetical protein